MTVPTTQTRNFATHLGIIGVCLWALGPLLNTGLRNIPTFEILAFVFTISFLFSAIKLSISEQWHLIKQPWFVWAIGILGIFGNDFFYISAFKSIPAAHVELINYLWPALVVLFSGALPREKFKFSKLLAAFFGFTGIWLLVSNNPEVTINSAIAHKGYLFAFLAATAWASYTLLARHFARIPIEMVGMYFGVCALLSLTAHHHYESFITPNYQQLSFLLLMGITTHGLAYWLYDYGIKNGRFQSLSIISNASPIIAICLLILFGKAELTLNLALAAAFVVLAAMVGTCKTTTWQRLFSFAWLRERGSLVSQTLKSS